MRKGPSLSLFLLFLLICLGIIAASYFGLLKGFTSFIESTMNPLQKNIISVLKHQTSESESSLQTLQNKNRELLIQLVEKSALDRENRALRDQFNSDYPKASSLIPAHVIGAPTFIPNVTSPVQFIIDKGEKEGMQKGQAVVFKNNLVGRIEKTSQHISVVSLVTSKTFSTTVKVQPRKESASTALGVVRGQDNGRILLDNVLLSENLKLSDIVVTKGDISSNSVGIPPDLVVGKIVSIEKKPSALFQSASIESLLHFSDISMVFVVKIL